MAVFGKPVLDKAGISADVQYFIEFIGNQENRFKAIDKSKVSAVAQ